MFTQRMRPKFKGDASFIPTADGVYLRGNNRRLMLKGKSLYTLLQRLIPHLTGSATLEELTAGLDAEKKRMVMHLVEKLLAHDFIKDLGQDRDHTLRPSDIETYASNIAFLDSLQTSASHLFETFRQQRLLLIGTGVSLISLVQAGLECGVKLLDAVESGEEGGQASPGAQAAGCFVPCDDEQMVQWMPTPCWEDESDARSAIQGYDAVVHIAGPLTLPRARILNRLCRDEQKVLVQAVVLAHQVWIGPLIGPGSKNCWECAWWRVQANGDVLLEQGDRSLTPAEAALVAHRLLFTLFRFVTRIAESDHAGQVSVLDLTTWQSERHHVLPHPYCSTCQHPVVATSAQFLARIRRLQEQEPLDSEHFLHTIVPCLDERCGLFTTLDATPFVQIPLAVYMVRLAGPEPAQARPPAALETGIGPQDARERALRKACERYAAASLPTWSLLSPRVVTQLAVPLVAPERVLGADPTASEPQAWVWALDLQTQQAALLPAWCLPPERGVASGQSWDEALCQALLDWCSYLTLEQVRSAQRSYPRVNLANRVQTPREAYLTRLLRASGAQVAVYDVTGPLGVPTFAICLDERVVAYSTHCEVGQALSLGLVRALQQYQAEHFCQSAYALDPVPDCPLERRSEQCCLPDYPLPGTWADRRRWLLERLQGSGLHGFAMPLDTDPALAQALPFLVRVLLCRDGEHGGESPL